MMQPWPNRQTSRSEPQTRLGTNHHQSSRKRVNNTFQVQDGILFLKQSVIRLQHSEGLLKGITTALLSGTTCARISGEPGCCAVKIPYSESMLHTAKDAYHVPVCRMTKTIQVF